MVLQEDSFDTEAKRQTREWPIIHKRHRGRKNANYGVVWLLEWVTQGLKQKQRSVVVKEKFYAFFFSYFVTRYFVVRWKLCKCAVKNPVLYSYRQYSNESGQENNVIAGSSLGLHAVWKTDFNLFHSFNLVYSLFILACWTLGPNKGPWWYRTWVEWHFRSRQKVVLKQRPEWR